MALSTPVPKPLVIVESPAKARTIAGFLGDDFHVESSVGHIRDLPSKGLSIDVDHHFTPTYEVHASKKDVFRSYLRREGESFLHRVVVEGHRKGYRRC